MKTAVEWLEDNLIFEPWAEEHFKHNSKCWDKAKEMEKEQIMQAFEAAEKYCGKDFLHGDLYYNETFKSE
jgi:hypothetical protein